MSLLLIFIFTPAMPEKTRHNRRLKYFINYFLGPLLFTWLAYSIYHQIQQQPGLEQSWQHISDSFNSSRIWLLFAVMVLMLVNWSIETIKWKLVVQRIQKVDFVTALKAVLSGVSFSVVTPNRVGEYLGRVLYMEEGKRLKAISLTITGSISQLIVTLVMGLIGLLILQKQILATGVIGPFWMDVATYSVVAGVLILTLFYFRLAVLVRWVDRLPGIRRYAWLLESLEDFNATLLLQLLSLSTIRFIVFIIQYFLLFRLFDVDVSLWQG
ncbi:MAG: hypothetical protein EOO01_29170, partial [Chitinophagaceae bacterium]